MFCPHCGGARSNDKYLKCEHCGVVLRRRRGPIIAVVAIFVVVLGVGSSIVGNKLIKMARLNERLEEAVGRDSGYTETILKIEAESGSMTYAELFSLCEKSIEDRTRLIIELRGLYPDIDSEMKTALVEHLAEENELVRQKVAFYRKQMELNSSLELYLDQLADTPTSPYGWDYYNTRLARLKADASDAISGMIEEGTEFVSTYEKLVDKEKDLGASLDQAGLRFVRVFEKYKSQNVGKAREAIKTAQSLKV